VVCLGGIEAIRRRVAEGAGVAVLPAYLVAPDLERRAVRRVFPDVELSHDHFRLVYRGDDARRPVLQKLAEAMLETPLR
jgi:DNA-binding transcriptional LysR family regulator